ncbi:MAG: hypothetical protein AUJ70_02550 [Candidatus Omnitrophica bacterium CG1_02_40_15]|nr:MAG: hypothetical protein AUJ70_02550 [Candidatus Omnitrophica bacterium CG1_02_40_15]
MSIYDFVEKYFVLLKTFQGWSLIVFGFIAGLMLYQAIHRSELSELQLKRERLDAISQQQNLTGEELSKPQIKFLRKLISYQEVNDLTKVVIGKDGIIFDDKQGKPTGINVISDFLEKDPNIFVKEDLEKLIYSIPEKYLKFIPETRFGAPYVIRFNEPAKEIVDKR